MTADVYAGDVAPPESAARSLGAARFEVIADAHADLVVRVGAALNLLNVAPRLFHMESRPEGTAAVSAWVDCAEPQAELIARKLQQLTSVRDVVLKYAAAEKSAAQSS
jgi:hypothetical protein